MMQGIRGRWKSWRRNASALLGDVSFKRNLRILGVVLLLSALCFGVLWYLGVGIKAEVYYQSGGRHVLTFHEYLFSILGAIDADPDAAPVYAMYSAFVRLVGAILIGGVLTSFLCSLLSRFSDMTLRGLLVPVLSDHVVIVGYTALADDIIRTLLLSGDDDPYGRWYPCSNKRNSKRKRVSKVLLYTSGDVQSIRDTLNSVLENGMERRIVYAFGDMDMTNRKMAKEICQKLSLLSARAVIVLGDACDPGRGDLKNLAFASAAGGFVRDRRLEARDRRVNEMSPFELDLLRYDSRFMPTPFYVQMDDVPTVDLIKKMEYKIGSRMLDESMMLCRKTASQEQVRMSDLKLDREKIKCVDLGAVGVYIRPFSYYEGWARAIWGAPYPVLKPRKPGEGNARSDKAGKAHADDGPFYFPLDFRPMDANSYVHLVVVGLSNAGEALVIEAIRICHYPNGRPTLITVVDSNPDVITDFSAHHPEVMRPEVMTLMGITLDLRCERLQSETVRSFISRESANPNCLLTVAICLKDIEKAMFEGLCLPDEVYCTTCPQLQPRVLVYQEHVNGDPEDGDSTCPVRYGFVRPFGMQEYGLQTRCMRSFASMYLNAAFFWPIDADKTSLLGPIRKSLEDPDKMRNYGVSDENIADLGKLKERIEEFEKQWGAKLMAGKQSSIPHDERYSLIKDVISSCDLALENFMNYAFRRFLMMEPVKEWSNVYVPDSYGTVLRSIGLTAKKSVDFVSGSAASFKKLCEDNEAAFTEARNSAVLERSLEEVEHSRWIADRALMGYSPARPGKNESRDDGYRYHNAMRPYSEIRESEIMALVRNKDALVVKLIPLILALEGFSIIRNESNAKVS